MSGLLDRVVYLSIGLSLILAFIGVKLVLHFVHLHVDGVPEISTGVSSGAITITLLATTVASLIRSRGLPDQRAHARSRMTPMRSWGDRIGAGPMASRDRERDPETDRSFK